MPGPRFPSMIWARLFWVPTFLGDCRLLNTIRASTFLIHSSFWFPHLEFPPSTPTKFRKEPYEYGSPDIFIGNLRLAVNGLQSIYLYCPRAEHFVHTVDCVGHVPPRKYAMRNEE